MKKQSKKRKNVVDAYYFIDVDPKEIAKYSLMRDLLSAGALILQAVMLFAFPTAARAFMTENYPSIAYLYIWLAIVMLAVSLYVCIMNFTLYKLNKRIPKKRAPKKGFEKRVFWGTELFIAANAVLTALEISFVCVKYDVWGVAATLVSAIATTLSVLARQASHVILRQASYIPSPDEPAKEIPQNEEKTSE